MEHSKRASNPRRGGGKGESANTLILPVTSALHSISLVQDFVYDVMSKGNNNICKLEDGEWAISYNDRGEAAAAYRALRLLLPEGQQVELHEAQNESGQTQLVFPEDFVVKLTIVMSDLKKELDTIKETYERSPQKGIHDYRSLEERMARLELISPIDAETMLRLRQAYQNIARPEGEPSNRDFVTRVQNTIDTLNKGEPVISRTRSESIFQGILMTTMNKVHEARGEPLASLSYTEFVDHTTHNIARVPDKFVDVLEHAVRGMPPHFMSQKTGTDKVPPSPYIPAGTINMSQWRA